MKILFICFLITQLNFACSRYEAEYISSMYNGKVVLNNEIPMYNKMVKDEYLRKVDAEFIASSREMYGGIHNACIEHVKFGWGYLYRDDYKTSIKRFNQAWLLDSTQSDVYFGFAAYCYLTGNMSESELYYNIGKNYDRENKALKIYHTSLIMFLTEKKRNNEVISFLKKYELGDSLFSNVEGSIGFYYMEANNYDSSFHYLNLAITNNPSDSISMLNLGWLSYLNKKPELAIEYYTRAISFAPNYIDAYSNRGLTYSEIKDYENAIKDNLSCIALSKYSEQGQYFRVMGYNKILLGRIQEGCKDLNKSLEIGDPTFDEDQIKDLIKKTCKE